MITTIREDGGVIASEPCGCRCLWQRFIPCPAHLPKDFSDGEWRSYQDRRERFKKAAQRAQTTSDKRPSFMPDRVW